MAESYQRHLPHQVPSGFPIFLTWNLKGAFSAEALERILEERLRLDRELIRPDESPKSRKIRHDKLLFALSDRILDRANRGPQDLKEPENARIVEEAILSGAIERYTLFAWCIMANHVHVLLTPHTELSVITQKLKGSSAFQINGRQNERGRVFWQGESYDHWARDEDEVMRIIEYIENNPVAAGLCGRPEQWQWSSARFRNGWRYGMPFHSVG